MKPLSEKTKLWAFRIVVALFVLVLAFVPQTEVRSSRINSRVIVEVLGIDKSEDEIEVSALVSLPKSQEQQAIKAASGKGETLSDAINDLDVSLGKSGALGLTTAVILGDGSFTQELEYLLTSTDVTAGVTVAAVIGKASDFVIKLAEFMESAGLSDSSFLSDSAKYSDVMPKTLVGFLSDKYSASKTALMPLYEFRSSAQEGEGGQSGQGGQTEQGEQSGQGEQGGQGEQSGGQSGQSKAQIDGLKITRLVAYKGDAAPTVFTEEQSSAIALIASDERAGYLRADLTFEGEKYKLIARIEHRSSSVNVPTTQNATVKLNMLIQLINESEYAEFLTGGVGARFQDEVRQAFESEIKDRLERAYAVTTGYGLDVFKIGAVFYRTHPYDSLDITKTCVDFNVNVKLR